VETQPTAADTFTIGGTVYTVQASGANSAGEVNVGADVAAAKLNIVAAINGTDGWNDPNPSVSAAAFVSDDCVLTARLPGTAGNSIATTETFTAGTNIFDAATLGTTTAGAFARGTAAAATSKIALEKLEWGDDDEAMYMPRLANGMLIRNTSIATPTKHGTRFSFSDQPVVWEQLPHWLTLALKGAPVLTYVPGSPDLWKWVWTRTPNANPAQQSVTLERLMSDGDGNTIEERALYAMLSEMSLSYAEGEHLRMSGSGFARRMKTNSVTAALTLPTPQVGVSALSRIYLDALWANAGDTLVAEQVIGWQWSHNNGLMPLLTAEGRTDLDFTKHQIDANNVTADLTVTALLDPTMYAAENTAAEAGTIRAVQVKVDGGGGRLLTIDGLYRHAKPTLFKIGSQDGQDIVEMALVEATDLTNFLEVTLWHPSVNSLA
ncbi:MAG: hypothetical protein IT301_05225, partial [Dehalococcoidia bacterium]|nr:hypothetical protein [Dehalococcoidia bacterium]